MKENKMVTMVVIVTIVSILLVFGGITFAYFSAFNNQGSTAVATIDTGKMIITYNDGTEDLLPITDIQPSDKILVNKTFTLTGTNTATGMKTGDGLSMPYKVGIQYTSTFSDGMLHYYIKEVERPTNSNVIANYVITPETGKTEDDYKNQTIPGNDTYTGYTHGTFKNGSKYTEMVTGVFPALKTDQTIKFNLIIQFPDNGLNQDSEKGKTFNGKVVVNYEDKKTLLDYITQLDKASNGLEVDDTLDNNLRYVGASPRNYLKFNGETWRIIGVFNNITTIDENGKEKKESLVKIVRNDSLGDYSWDTSKLSINNGWGVNEWSQADLMTELNTDYINTSLTSGTTLWYNDYNNAKNGTYEYKNNIKSDFIDKIAKVRWNTSGVKDGASALNSYNQERSTTLIGPQSDNVPRNNTWDGKIVLIFPSDYGYASTDTACRSILSSSNCKNDNWLFNSAKQWILSPDSGNAYDVFYVHLGGAVYSINASTTKGVRPALFLKSDVVRAGGTGESVENAYTLG